MSRAQDILVEGSKYKNCGNPPKSPNQLSIHPNKKISEIQVDMRDFKRVLKEWWYILDERCDWDNKEFDNILKKYDLEVGDII